MYVYIESEHNLWTVGFYKPDGNWNPESDWPTTKEAADRVHWLNGGDSNEVHSRQDRDVAGHQQGDRV
jgi:hypothetical protein